MLKEITEETLLYQVDSVRSLYCVFPCTGEVNIGKGKGFCSSSCATQQHGCITFLCMILQHFVVLYQLLKIILVYKYNMIFPRLPRSTVCGHKCITSFQKLIICLHFFLTNCLLKHRVAFACEVFSPPRYSGHFQMVKLHDKIHL